jgi:hypothetical protein
MNDRTPKLKKKLKANGNLEKGRLRLPRRKTVRGKTKRKMRAYVWSI